MLAWLDSLNMLMAVCFCVCFVCLAASALKSALTARLSAEPGQNGCLWWSTLLCGGVRVGAGLVWSGLSLLLVVYCFVATPTTYAND